MTDDLSMIERAAYDRGFFDGFNAGIHSMRVDLEKANAERAEAIIERDKAIIEYCNMVGNSELARKCNQLEKERDAAIEELRSIPLNCFCCRWADGNNCKSPTPCLVDGNPDRWEWRGATND